MWNGVKMYIFYTCKIRLHYGKRSEINPVVFFNGIFWHGSILFAKKHVNEK